MDYGDKPQTPSGPILRRYLAPFCSAVASQWVAVALVVGAGAILQVVVEVSRLLVAESRRTGTSRTAGPALLGVGAGAGVMYATALLVQV